MTDAKENASVQMMHDTQIHMDDTMPAGWRLHNYGEHVHVYVSAVTATLLAAFCDVQTPQYLRRVLVGELYQRLADLWLNRLADRTLVTRKTPMAGYFADSEADWRGDLQTYELDFTHIQALVVNTLRAGDLPAQTVADRMLLLQSLRRQTGDTHDVQIHYFGAERQKAADGSTDGTNLGWYKIGEIPPGDEKLVIIIPDPMLATGGSVCGLIDFYLSQPAYFGREVLFVGLFLIAAPEGIRAVRHYCDKRPEFASQDDTAVTDRVKQARFELFAFRVDRQMSDDTVLKTSLGMLPSEQGLTPEHYIAPGAGDVGANLNGTKKERCSTSE